MHNYLEGLNAQQREAVEHIEGPIMIVAGAGSGKTKVLTTRIAHLMNKGVDAFNILALTFTNKAAAEMKERVEAILGNSEARNLYIGTFHSVFARILRAEANKIGYPNNFTIYDTDDAKNVIKAIVKDMNLDDKHYKPAYVYNRISAAKNSLIDPVAYKEDTHIQQEDARSSRPMIGDIYQRYANQCFKNGAMDFDDLLFKMYLLLKHVPEVLAKYQHKFQYILIDEYQDTNPAQYQIIKMLGSVHENICVVGDDAQSIYSFRGATIHNILQFQEDYDDVKVIKLEQNYRSTQSILNAANNIISNNRNQIPKSLWTENVEGDKIMLVRTITDNDEGRFVADAITEMKLRNHYRNNDFAILYRTNAQSRSFEESLRRMNIPCRLYGGISFYQRKEIKDFLAYLRIIVNTQDEENIKRIINYPVRGIGKTTIEKILVFANEQNITMWEAMHHTAHVGLRGGAATAVENFVTMIKSFQTMLEKQNAYDVAFAVGKHTELVKDLYNDKSVEGLARYENVQELLNSIKEFTETPDEEGELRDKSLGSYLQQITLLTDADNEDEENDDSVKLMTVHAAKGLEFPCVFVVGLEENLFPSAMSLYDREDLEEERRLFYVATTRAKQRLWVCYATSRYRFGQLVQNEPSRFIDELPENHLDRTFTGPSNRAQGSVNAYGGTIGRSFNKALDKTTSLKKLADKIKEKKPAEHKPLGNFISDNPMDMEVGMDVEHIKFGFGNIKNLEGGANNRIATIEFKDGHGIKKIMLNYAKIRIVR
ncbi:MAG: UvrD-helicase domain-containing protein [Chitinophagales bacterium]|nr:UvrD-helicase domain-containing protein [Chitinophagaceae bacterium]MCB9065350.1 UvrD-helicase domain-containing protein [Chitinophagales bacterium]